MKNYETTLIAQPWIKKGWGFPSFDSKKKYDNWLVVYLQSWKMMEFVNGFRMTSHIFIMENNPFMFLSTNQFSGFTDDRITLW